MHSFVNKNIHFYIYTSEEVIYHKPVALPILYRLIEKVN